jgi:DNA invertase Pin-like site-specific DNA recombinase
MIQGNPAWEFGGIFSDNGVSGTSVAGRKGFQRMMEAAGNHEIDLIVTKDMSRFGRNCREILTNLKVLADLKPPVGVIFELPGLFSLDPKNDLLITILSAIAQMEAQQKSESIRRGIRNRMHLGIFKFTVRNTLGYYRDFYGRIKVDEAEAELVKFIYESFLEGVSPVDIAYELTSREISTPTGLYIWRTGTILGILSNEKYTGNALQQKYIVKNYLDHKTSKNDIIPMIMAEKHHPAIIEQEEWDKAQELLRIRKTQKPDRSVIKAMKALSQFHFVRIKSGPLKGHYLLDCNWTRAQREYFLRHIISKNKD